MRVGMNGVRRPGRCSAAVGRRAADAWALADVPAVVRSGLCLVDLLPRVLPDVVDEEARPARIRVEAEPERVAQAPGERLAAPEPGRRAPREPARRAIRALEG